MKRTQLVLACLTALSLPALAAEDPHAGHHGMDHSMHMHKTPEKQPKDHPGPEIPEPTDEDRAAAFPDLGGMDLRKMMDTPLLAYSLLDQFEWVDTDDGSALSW